MVKNVVQQAGVVGDHAVVHHMTVQGVFPDQRDVPDIDALAGQLAQLRQAMQQHAGQAEQFVEIGNVATAEVEAKKGNWDGVLNALKAAGKWTLDIARDIGVDIASEVIRKTAGL
ncbi:MAG: hypothetical protein V4463_14140 [Pseudomonadota bacterium]